MVLKRNIKHPNFIIGLISYLLLMTGVVLNAYGSDVGNWVILLSLLLGGLHWAGTIIDVSTDGRLKNDQLTRTFWIGVIIMVPPLAGMIYYMADRKRISL